MSCEKGRHFTSTDIQKYLILGSLRQPIDRAVSTNSFSSEDPLASVSLSAIKLKLCVNDNDSKENEIKCWCHRVNVD